MFETNKWARITLIVGLAAMILGVLDPMEGSVVILGGSALVALSAYLGHSRFRTSIYWAFALLLVGIGTLFGMSALGGIGGSTGRSLWWALLLLPYPIGWVLGLYGAIRRVREPGAPIPAG